MAWRHPSFIQSCIQCSVRGFRFFNILSSIVALHKLVFRCFGDKDKHPPRCCSMLSKQPITIKRYTSHSFIFALWLCCLHMCTVKCVSYVPLLTRQAGFYFWPFTVGSPSQTQKENTANFGQLKAFIFLLLYFWILLMGMLRSAHHCDVCVERAKVQKLGLHKEWRNFDVS